jgi:hypothetical protein
MSKELLNQGEIEALLNELEAKMQRLRAIYEQYFLGIERTPPTTLQKDVFRLIQRAENIFIRNTAQKFRLRALVQRFSSYKAYWSRVERQIEEGTYVRDIHRARRNQERRKSRSTNADDNLPILELDLEFDGVDDLQAEIEEMERAGAFDSHDRRPVVSKEPQIPVLSDAEKEERRLEKLAEIRRQLNPTDAPLPAAVSPAAVSPSAASPSAASASADSASSPAGDDRQSKLDRLKTRLNRSDPAPAANEIRGADMDQLRKLAAMKAKIEADRAEAATAPAATGQRTIQRSTGAQRVVQRPAPQEDEARQVYDKLIATKRQLNESTQGLSYDQVRQSMQTQRDQLRQSRGAADVDFQVVVKDGRAFLKPVPK